MKTILLILGLASCLLLQEKRSPLPDVGSYGDRIEIRKDVAFGSENYQKLDLYLPKGDGPFPTVLCWFGGGFTGGDKAGMGKVGAFLASKGIAAVAPNYFLADKLGERPGWPRNLYDAKSAVRFTRSKCAEWRLDSGKFAGLGSSSGAYLALMVGFTPNLKELEGSGAATDQSSALSAVVDMAGVCDRRRSLGTGTVSLLGKGYEEKDDLRAQASPILYVGPKTVPVYILHGDQDKTVDLSSARQLDQALTTANVPHQFHIVEGGGHDPNSLEAMEKIVVWLRDRLK